MGYYIQTGTNTGKAETIAKKFNGKIIARPNSFSDVPKDKGLICVINNGMFDAAGFVYSEQEFKAFCYGSDTRGKTWVLIPIEDAKRESNYDG
jgi:hypothetical protein